MGGAAIVDLLPRDAELARRAAGGDGTAFVRLYDRYSPDVLEATLATTGAVEAAAEGTQAAFLTLLRRPPAIDAPDHDVLDRLVAMARAAVAESRASDGAGVGWLRSETVAKAGARFDADWSSHLAGAEPAGRTAADVVFSWQEAETNSAEGIVAERPVPEPASRPARRRRFRLRTVLRFQPPLPSPAALAAIPAIGAIAAALAVLAAGGRDGERTETLASLDAARLAPLAAIAEGDRPRSDPVEPAPAKRRTPRERPASAVLASHTRTPSYAGDEAPAPRVRTPRAPATGGTLGVTRSRPAPSRGGRLAVPPRKQATVVPPPPAVAPEAPPAQPDASPAPITPAPAPTPAPTESAPAQPQSPNGGGVRRNCNSKRSPSPC